MIALIETDDGVAVVDLEEEVVVGIDPDGTAEREPVTLDLPRVIAADRSGSFTVAVVDRRPPLVVSRDAEMTWHEAGGGLASGVDVAISPVHPDVVLYASASRLYLSEDGGRFWRALAVEFPGIRAIAWDA